MEIKKIYFVLALVSWTVTALGFTGVDTLRCEGLANPLGVDVAQPRLSWKIESHRRGESQTAYEVVVASTPENLAKDKGDFWDSGKVASAESIQVEYGGQPLISAMPYYWKVRIWNLHGSASRWSEPATFTAGLYTRADWHSAQWIAFRPETQWRTQWEQSVAAETKGVKQSFPWLTGQGLTIWEHYAAALPPYDASPLFRKEFKLDRPVRRAALYICGLGYCEVFLNGKRIGDHVLDPAWTCYQKRAFYVTHNVTAQLKPGVNALGAMLGRGQFSPLCNDIWGLRRAKWVDQPRLIARLNVVYADGTSQNIVTDSSWRTSGGPIIYDDTRHGEIYDARREQPGWTAAGFDGNQWQAVSEVSAQNPLQAQLIPPIREFPALEPVRCIERSKHEKLFDAGRNLAGWARVTVHGAPGAKVLVDYAEVPFDLELRGHYPCGKPAPELAHPEDTFRDLATHVRQQNGYMLKGGGAETFTCHFSYKGFQFIRVVADDGVSIDHVQAVPVHSDVAAIGDFECSNPLLNQIQRAAQLTFLNNFHSLQTDCPHREKQGWMADLYLTAEAAMYNFDMAAFYSKCVNDVADTQNPTGGIGLVAPSGDYNRGASTLWPAALVYLPANLLTFYGDRRTVEQHYAAMKRFALSSLLRQVPGKPEVITDVLGDWASPLDHPSASGETSVMSPPEGRTLYGTAAHFRVVKTLAKLGRQLGKDEEASEFDAWARRIAEAFNREFFDAGQSQYHGEIDTDYRQAANAVPLDYGLVPASGYATVLDHLVENVHITRRDRLNTGFVGTPALLNVLAEARPDLAYALAAQTNYPSWGWMMKTGGTTIYEQFGGDNSHDHPMFGCVSAYFYQHLAGIQPDPAAPGFGHFFIRPGVVGDLTWVRSHFDSPHGRIVSNWKLTGRRLTMNVTIPANTTATIYVPAWPGKPDESVEEITESGKPVASVKSIKSLNTENGSAVFAVESGSYEFTRE
jgi:alpha-L-rhamnosidase